MRIAIAVFEGVEELDFAGPWEVLATWRDLCANDVEVVLVGESTAPVTCAKGMRVVPEMSWSELADVEVLVHPGGRGTRAQLGNETVRARLRALKERGTLMTSVCAGALVFADAGLLDGRPAATYWMATSASSTTAKSSPRPGYQPASTWRCTSSVASARPIKPGTCAA